MEMTENLDLIVRLLVSGAFGAIIGIERELRSKVAGLRTHFLVTFGSALFMIISQWGFQTSVGTTGLRGADTARIAAQIVSGIGFIGAGTIMMQRKVIRGLTTAAGLWVCAGIGMAVGGGLYLIGAVSTLLTLVGLEVFGIIFPNLKPKNLNLVFSTKDKDNISTVINALAAQNFVIKAYSVTHISDGDSPALRIKINIRSHANLNQAKLLQLMKQLPEVMVEKIY
ncbi:MgtC/SapB family protein [Spirochaetota bacterium]